MMLEPSHIAVLRKCLAQCEEAIPLISDVHDRQIEVDHAELLRVDIRRMEEWEAKQKRNNGFVQAEDANGGKRRVTGEETPNGQI